MANSTTRRKFRIRRDDMVVVTAGKHRGAIGRVVKVMPERERVLVEKVNVVKRRLKPQGDRPGGTIEKEAPIHVSNVALWNAEEGRRVKIGWKILDDGRKVRVDRATGEPIDQA